MKATGVVRPVDGLGRLVLPIELRRKMDINNGDLLEIFVDKEIIVLKKYKKSCAFCGVQENIVEFKENYICNNFLKNIKKIY